MTDTTEKIDWVKIKPAEVEKIIIDLGKQGKDPEEIGLILRDQHGIPKAKLITGKKIKQTLKGSSIKTKTDLERIQLMIDKVQKHIVKNKQDKNAQRSLTRKLWIAEKKKKSN